MCNFLPLLKEVLDGALFYFFRILNIVYDDYHYFDSVLFGTIKTKWMLE